MEEKKFGVIAIYRDGHEYRVLLGNGESYYEMICYEAIAEDITIVNSMDLATGLPISKDELKIIIGISSTIFKETIKSYLKNMFVFLSKNPLDEEQKNELRNINTDGLGYSDVYIDSANDYLMESKFGGLKTEPISAESEEDFISKYEDKYLRDHRLYSLQRTEGVLSWDEYFMALAKLTSMRSKDPNTQVGACIVGNHHKIISVGYNGAPRGIEDDKFPWARIGHPLHTKYMYVCHAEMNAISNYNGPRSDFDGSTLYVDLFPCNECAKLIIQAGVKKVVYLSDKYANTDSTIASKRMFDLAGVEYVQLEERKQQEPIVLSLNPKDK